MRKSASASVKCRRQKRVSNTVRREELHGEHEGEVEDDRLRDVEEKTRRRSLKPCGLRASQKHWPFFSCPQP
jgi:hypothetical protein